MRIVGKRQSSTAKPTSGRVFGKPDCDLKAVGMIVWQGGNRSDRAPHRTSTVVSTSSGGFAARTSKRRNVRRFCVTSGLATNKHTAANVTSNGSKSVIGVCNGQRGLASDLSCQRPNLGDLGDSSKFARLDNSFQIRGLLVDPNAKNSN